MQLFKASVHISSFAQERCHAYHKVELMQDKATLISMSDYDKTYKRQSCPNQTSRDGRNRPLLHRQASP